MKLYFQLIALALIFISCSKETKNIDDLFSNTIKAKTERLDIKSNNIILPIWELISVDGYFVTSTYMNEKNIYVYDIENEKFAFDIFSLGRGPNELTGDIKISPRKTGLVTFSNNDKCIIVMDSIYDGCDYNTTKIKLPASSNTYSNLILLIDNVAIASGIFYDTDKQFALLNNKLEPVAYFEDFPEAENQFSNRDLAMGFQGEITALNGTEFVYNSMMSGVMKFFKYSDSKVVMTKEYITEIPKFKSYSDDVITSVGFDKSNQRGILDVATSENEYFMLYSAKAFEERNIESNIIYCFSPAGEPNRKITLDRQVEKIVFSKKFNKLYALGTEKDKPYFYEIIL